jgi:spore coat polysaccharide biosynthesis protein SpsF (cytidylyltransferase family)
MRTLVILQARQGSSRLPGKSMMPIAGRPMLAYTIESILQVAAPRDVYLATSQRPENELLRKLATRLGIQSLCGDESDVASRYVEILQREPDARYFQRVCGDSPLYDHRVLELGRQIASKSPDLQVVTSLPNRGYPQGMNLEMIERDAFLDGCQRFSKPGHFEHVTQYLYEHLHGFRHRLVHCAIPGYEYSKWKFSVDTREEFERMAALVESLDRPHYTYPLEELCRLLDIWHTPPTPAGENL